MKKIGRVDYKIGRVDVYKVTKGDEVFEGTTFEVADYLKTKPHIFHSALWRFRKSGKKVMKFKGYTVERTHVCSQQKVYKVINQNDEEITRGTLRKLATQFGYKFTSLKTLTSSHRPMTIRRKKYYILPTNEYDIVWTRVH